MGNTIATNILNDAITQTIDNQSQIGFNAAATATGANVFRMKNCTVKKGGEINVNQQNIYTVDLTTLQKAIINSDNKNELEKNIQQVADVVAQNFDLNPGQKASINAMNLSTQLATDIYNSIQQNCLSDVSTLNLYECKDSSVAGKVIVDQSSFSKSVLNCAQDAYIKSSAYNKLVENISQVAKTKVENAIFMILAMIAVILLIIFGGGAMGISNLLRNIVILATLLLGLVFLDCYLTKLLCSTKFRGWVIAIAVTIYVLVIFTFFYSKIKSRKGK